MSRSPKGGLTPIFASQLPAGDLRFEGPRLSAVICPTCGNLPTIDRRWVIDAHYRPGDPGTRVRCTGSRRRILRDRPVEVLRHEAEAARILARRRAVAATPPPNERRRCKPPPASRPDEP